ncbi:MAG: PaaI family thioesterase [Eubacteriales bacterium]|nr:PaaI family thioesterase [Eubacteriales bacterium]MDD4389991.1 PaaI family thioesterase [Eubacteriales bacterium]
MSLTGKIENMLSTIEKNWANSMNAMMNPEFRSGIDETNEYTIAFPIKEWQLNPKGTLHGGICSTAFDISMGMGCAAISQSINFVTVDMYVSYIGIMTPEDCLLIKSKILKLGSKFCRVYAEGYSEKTGKLIATANGTYLFLEDNQR